MAIDIIARGLALSLLGDDGKFTSDLMPGLTETGVTQYAVGGIPEGVSLEGKTTEEIMLLMLFGVVAPTLTNPSLSIVGTPLIGTANRALEISGKITFDRGTINPANGTSGFRAGLPSYYIIGDKTQVTQATDVNFTYLIPSLQKGNNTISIIVHYDEGEQPRDSQGKEFDKPLPAGQLSQTLTIVGFSPIYAGLNDNGTELFLADVYFDYTDRGEGAGYQLFSDAEINIDDKWAFLVPADQPVVGIKQFDIMSQTWQWLGGDPASSLAYFNQESIIKEIDGLAETYTQYQNALDLVGERELRFYITLPEEE